MNNGELFKLAREKNASEDALLNSVRESVIAELEGLASEAKQFTQAFETRLAAIVSRARGLVDGGEKLEAGGRLPQGASLADMDRLDRELNAILEGGPSPNNSGKKGERWHVENTQDPVYEREAPPRPEIIAVRDGRD